MTSTTRTGGTGGRTASAARAAGRRRAILGLAAAAAALLAVTGTQVVQALGPTAVSRGPVTDLQPAAASAFDGASAQVTLARSDAGATATLHVWDVGAGAADGTFGAHLHTGTCVHGAGSLAGGHYNADLAEGVSPARVTTATEVWLDLAVHADGRGQATAVVPFAPTGGVRSVVIHALPTDPATGLAGARLACLPVVIP